MKFNIKKFKKNIVFFILSITSLILILVISLVMDNTVVIEEVELDKESTNVRKLVINEIMTSNKGAYADGNGELYDYVEIYNGSSKEINLINYGLSDVTTEIKYTFPDITLKSKEYIVVFLSGTNNGGLYAPFKLKSSGDETLALFKSNGKIVDAVETTQLLKNTVMARNKDGNWVVQNKPTPGYENSIEGYEKFFESLLNKEEQNIIINEILPNNKGNFKTSFDEFSGYIEIKNCSDETIDLENYGLSNSETVLYKWQFPSIKLKKGEVLVIYTSNRNIKDSDEYHTSFKLNSINGVVILSDNKGKVIEKVSYTNLANGIAYIKQGNNFLESNIISPGYENNLDGIKDFEKKFLEVPNTLVINEVMNNNYSYLSQNGGNYYDWIELYNNSNKQIKLNDYCLTTNIDTKCMYKLPEVTLESGKYYIIMASGDEKLSNNSYKHSNFKLSDTQSLYLINGDEVVDSLFMANIPKGYSMGLKGNYGKYYFSKPTPNAKNSNGVQAISYTPYSSIKAGAYNESITVELIGTGNIYYTLDGSTPSVKSKKYTKPLNIKNTTVLKAISVENGKLNSDVSTYTYIINGGHKLPILSVSINPSDLNYLNRNAWNEGVIKQAYAEYFDTNDSGFQIGAGLKLFGGSTRGHSKKSFELKFKKMYGEARLNYQVFGDVDSSVFDSIVIRSGSQDEMGNASKKSLIRDIVGTSLVNEYTNVDVQSYKPIVLYLNGKYWGLYFLREKVDETFIANHYNVNATKNNTDILRIDGQVKSGTSKKYNNMINFIENNSLGKKENYEKIKEQIDIENLCDFWIAENWISNNDILNVRFFSNPEVDNGKWKFIFYDLDFAFYNTSINYFNFFTRSSGMTDNHYSTFLLRNLMKNNEFKKTFLERLSYNLKNTWSDENVINKIDEVIEEIGIDEIKRNLSRWNMSYSTWVKSINHLKNYAKKRGNYVKSQAKSYFKLSSSEYNKYFGE